jgi:hypothetical protein
MSVFPSKVREGSAIWQTVQNENIPWKQQSDSRGFLLTVCSASIAVDWVGCKSHGHFGDTKEIHAKTAPLHYYLRMRLYGFGFMNVYSALEIRYNPTLLTFTESVKRK